MGSDYLCHNLRCISVLLKCDDFDHCGDNSDELRNCSEHTNTRPEWSKPPNFLFPNMNDHYNNLTAATLIFLICSFGKRIFKLNCPNKLSRCHPGLIGIIFGMAFLLYRVNMKAHQQRQIQNHIETINAILEESVGDVEETIIIPDDPPDYEPPPEYGEVVKMENNSVRKKIVKIKRSRAANEALTQNVSPQGVNEIPTPSLSKNTQTTPDLIPDSPPPNYTYVITESSNIISDAISDEADEAGASCFAALHPGKLVTDIGMSMRKSLHKCKPGFVMRNLLAVREKKLVRYFSESELFNIKMRMDCCFRRTILSKHFFKKSFSTDDIMIL